MLGEAEIKLVLPVNFRKSARAGRECSDQPAELEILRNESFESRNGRGFAGGPLGS
jgi:hypothetical protein